MLSPLARRSWSWWRRILLRGLFGTWVAGFLVLGAYQLAPHLLTLPVSQAGDAVVQRFTAARLPAQQGRWLVLHVLDEDCPCSLRVLEHLFASPRPVDVAERVVLIARPGDAARIAAIRAHGFDLDVVTAEQLGERYHLDAAPLLVVVDPANAVRYLGGYTPRKQAADVREAAIVAAVMRGERVAPLPTFGCAVGAALRTTVDPLGIRRWN
jgi:hypothetical protein